MRLEGKYAAWLRTASLQAVFDAIEAAGGEVRVNGGAVRNSLMGLSVGDVDLSTTLVPDETIKALEAANLKAIPTGYEHGTITAVSGKTPYEITTLREDIETDGRHAIVKFGTSWELDAKRRDLTMNALYCDREGIIYDPLNGLADLEARQVRFIGEAEERIEEDHLRILRFFRFFGWYGSGRPDADGLKACAKLKTGLEKISVERIWIELHKLLLAPDPSRALLWMRTTGVLNIVLPESEKWGIDFVPHLIASEAKWRWKPDPLVRFAAMIRPDAQGVVSLCRRLKLSNEIEKRLTAWAMAVLPAPDLDELSFAQHLYGADVDGLVTKMKLEIARLVSIGQGDGAEAKLWANHLKHASKWKRPVFPVKGQDLLEAGHTAGPELGKILNRLEESWLESGFKLSKTALLKLV